MLYLQNNINTKDMENYSDDIGSGCSLQAEDDYGELLKLHARLRRYAISLAGYGDAADELLQDALLHIMLQLNKYEPYGSFYAWASKLMHNSFVNNVNRKQTYSRIITELGKRYSMQTEPSMSPDAENLICADYLGKLENFIFCTVAGIGVTEKVDCFKRNTSFSYHVTCNGAVYTA